MRRALVLVALVAAGISAAAAQSAPPVRPLGRVLNTSAESLAAVSQVRALPDGRVIVHDNSGRRVVMFDSTLSKVTLIADTTSATGNAYGSRIGGIIAYRGDSTLFVDPVTLSMLVIDGSGRVVRTMAAPRSTDVPYLIGGPFGTPSLDAHGRLVYRQTIRTQPDPLTRVAPSADSSSIVRFDFATRSLDTAGRFAIPKVRSNSSQVELNGRTIFRVAQVVNPMPLTDDWAVLSDGTIAVVRGHDYRVDFIDGAGHVSSGPKIPFEWERMNDDAKSAIIDSTRADIARRAALTAARDSAAGRVPPQPPPGFPVLPPMQLEFVSIDELPDYRPAFRQAAARGDADGNLWVRTSKMSNGGPVYDVINNKGALIDRVAIPPGRVIAGFGPGGMVYMGVVDGNITRLERARWH
jgi:hypothetical protein